MRKPMKNYLLFFILAGSLLISCTRTPFILETTPASEVIGGAGQPSISEYSNAAPDEQIIAAGEIYLLLITIDTPFNYRLAYLPLTCLSAGAECSEINYVSEFPQVDYSASSDSPFLWSPDSKWAIFLNNYNEQLCLLDPESQSISVITSDLPIISDQIAWSPDSQLVAIPVQGPDDYTGHIVLIDPISGEKRNATGDIPNLMQFPLRWVDGSDLIVLAQKYEEIASSKKAIAEVKFSKVNLQTDQWEDLKGNLHGAPDQPALSPGNRWLAFSQLEGKKYELYVMDLADKETTRLGIQGIVHQWSPNEAWIAAVAPSKVDNHQVDYDIFVVQPSGEAAHQVFHTDISPTFLWLPDSDHLLVMTKPEDLSVKTQLYIASISSENKWQVDIPALDSIPYEIAGISIRQNPNK